MKAIVFCGPTLPAEEVRAAGAEARPPAAFGDVYRAACERPKVIAIIDGLFQHTPAVWHKEILWALSEGIHVVGGASMGALRAAELAPFGMEGVGAIFEAYRSGAIEDDDDVAVAHAPAEGGWRALSDAMVDVRATLRAAVAAGIVDEGLAARLEGLGKLRSYPTRTIDGILREAMQTRVAAEEALAPLRRWLPTGRVWQKRVDARALLARVRQILSDPPSPAPLRFTFEHTEAWEEARRRAALGHTTEQLGGDELLVEELQLAGLFVALRDGAIVRGRAIEEARRRGLAIDDQAARAAVDQFRLERGLGQPDAFARWVAEQGFDGADGTRFFRDEALARWGRIVVEQDAPRYLADHLRATGDLAPFTARARAKQQKLIAQGTAQCSLADAGLSEPDLWKWFFVDRLERPVPDDLRRWAIAAGFDDESALRRAALREHAFLRDPAKR